MKIVTTESLPIFADNKTSITRGSAANSQGAKFKSPIVLAFANLTIGQSLICIAPGAVGSSSCYVQSCEYIPSFQGYESQKKTERRTSFHFRNKSSKKSRIEDIEVTIWVGVVDKLGEGFPVKVPTTAAPSDILQAALKNHKAYNKWYRPGYYRSLFIRWFWR